LFSTRSNFYPIVISQRFCTEATSRCQKCWGEIKCNCQCRDVIPQDWTYSRNVDSINSVRVPSRRICQILYSSEAGSETVGAIEVSQSHSPEVLGKNLGGGRNFRASSRYIVAASFVRSIMCKVIPPLLIDSGCTCP